MMPKLVDTGPSEFGWHRYDDLRCLRLYALSHGADMRTIPASALVRGSMAHVALGQHYARLQMTQQDKDPDEFYHVREGLAAYGETLTSDAAREVYSQYFGETLALHNQYLAQYGTDPRWKVIGVEEQFKVQVRDGDKQYPYTQSCDLVVQDRQTGEVFMIDHKTMARQTPRVIERYEANGQFVGYQWLGKLRYKEQFGGVIINALQKPKKGGRWGFNRVFVRPAPGMIRDFKKFIILSQRRLAAATEEFGENWDDWPSAPHSGNCYGPYGACQFLDRCRRGERG